MPKTDIDYSNTIIYKITCKDTEIKDVYVGHTTNFVQRKHAHKQGCINPKSSNYDCKLYNTIREKGGWTNWRMEILNFFNCFDHYEARQKEQEYFISLNANLNSIQPMPKPKEKEEKEEKEENEEITQSNTNTNTNINVCKCGKKYKHRQGLYLHKKTCQNLQETTVVDTPSNLSNLDISLLTNLMIEVLKNNSELQKQNQEFKELLVEQNNKLIELYKNK